jgi:hypothetical protein
MRRVCKYNILVCIYMHVHVLLVTGGGLSTIRCFGGDVEDEWRQKFYTYNDFWFVFFWFCLILIVLFIFCFILFVILFIRNIRFLLFNEGKLWAMLYSAVIATLYMGGVCLFLSTFFISLQCFFFFMHFLFLFFFEISQL